MVRLIPVVLLLLPLLMFLVWLVLARRKARLAQAGELPRWQQAPWTLILTVTAAVVGLMLLSLNFLPQGDPWSPYTPPVLQDGEVVPGHVDD